MKYAGLLNCSLRNGCLHSFLENLFSTLNDKINFWQINIYQFFKTHIKDCNFRFRGSQLRVSYKVRVILGSVGYLYMRSWFLLWKQNMLTFIYIFLSSDLLNQCFHLKVKSVVTVQRKLDNIFRTLRVEFFLPRGGISEYKLLLQHAKNL